MVTRISPSGPVTRVAGTGRRGFSGDGGPAIEAELGWVYDLAVDAAGNIFIVDQDNNRIRMVDTDRVITTIAGTGEPGFSGDGRPAPRGLDRMASVVLDGVVWVDPTEITLGPPREEKAAAAPAGPFCTAVG